MRKLLMIAALFLAGCISKHDVLPEKPVVVKKTIKDTDFSLKGDRDELKKRVLVLPFLDKNKELRSDEVREQSREAFILDLNKVKTLYVIPDNQVKISPDKYLSGAEYNLKKMAQDLTKQGVSSLIEGQIIDVRLKNASDRIGVIRDVKTAYEVMVRMRVLNVRSEQEVFNTVKTVTLEEATPRILERVSTDQYFARNPELVKILIKDAFLDFTPQIQDALHQVQWEGRIAALRDDKVYLNVGRISGVQIGDIFKVVEDGTEIYDPEIGYHLGKIRGRTKGTLEIVSYFGQDGAVATVYSGANFKEGDRVETYE